MSTKENNLKTILNKTNTNENNTKAHEKGRFNALRSISGVFAIMAWIIGAATLILTFYFLSLPQIKIMSLVALILGGALTVLQIALSEIIKLFLAIEKNTRKSAVE